jgi:hypothetical protein
LFVPRAAWDYVGVGLSILCAIHCAVTPLLLAALPTWGLSWLADEGVHQWLAGGALAIGGLAFWPGYRRHRRLIVPGLAFAALGLLTFGAFAAPDDCCAPVTNRSLADGQPDGADLPECCRADRCVAASSAMPINPQREPGVLSRLAPAATPIGGLLLVVAHLMNHSCCTAFGCRQVRKLTPSP